MSEDKRPIFPRLSESSNEEKNELRQQAKLNLEAEEQHFQSNIDTVEPKIICAKCQTESYAQAKFCRVCGNNLTIQLPTPPPAELNKVESELNSVDKTNLLWGKDTYYASLWGTYPVSRRLPPPLDKLNTGQQIPIFEKFIISNDVLLVLSHPLFTSSDRNQYGLKPIRAVEQDGEYFIELTDQIEPIDDPPIEGKEYPPPTIVKFHSKANVLEILSPEKFLEIVAVMQKKIDAGGSTSSEDRIEELAFAFNILTGKNSSVAPYSERDYEPVQFVYGPPNFWLKDESDDDSNSEVYGPPPMLLDDRPTELPFNLRNLKVDQEVMPPMPPMPTPVYGPPPMPFNELKNNKFMWLVIALLSGLLIIVVFIILILVVLISR